MSPKQFESELNYLAARELAESLMKQGFITRTEFRKIAIFLLRPSPLLSGSLSPYHLISRRIRASNTGIRYEVRL